jgi:hypothetical protein
MECSLVQNMLSLRHPRENVPELKDLEAKEGIEYHQSEMLSDKFKAVAFLNSEMAQTLLDC